jgi:hypothetical protein
MTRSLFPHTALLVRIEIAFFHSTSMTLLLVLFPSLTIHRALSLFSLLFLSCRRYGTCLIACREGARLLQPRLAAVWHDLLCPHLCLYVFLIICHGFDPMVLLFRVFSFMIVFVCTDWSFMAAVLPFLNKAFGYETRASYLFFLMVGGL